MMKEGVQKTEIELWDSKDYPHLTQEIIERLNCLLGFTEPGELREYLLEIYHLYIIHEHDNLPGNFKEVSESMLMLFDFLKFAQGELDDKKTCPR